jgi:hypothetical protein
MCVAVAGLGVTRWWFNRAALDSSRISVVDAPHSRAQAIDTLRVQPPAAIESTASWRLMVDKFNRIQIGMTPTEVEAVLGSPTGQVTLEGDWELIYLEPSQGSFRAKDEIAEWSDGQERIVVTYRFGVRTKMLYVLRRSKIWI